MALKQYNFKKVACVAGERQVTGFHEGSSIKVERDEDAFTLEIGADGEGTRSKSNNMSGTFTLTLSQSSDSNAFLSDKANADELSGSGLFPMLIKDNSGNSLHFAEQAWVQKRPSSEYGKTSGPREWVIRTDKLISYEGGN